MEKRDVLLNLIKDKKVFIGAHWDADGVCSGALIYHLIREHAASVSTISKGEVFQVTKEDIKGNPDIIICVDIHPAEELDKNKVIYIDHHPSEDNDFLLSIHNDKTQSCTLLIWEELLQDTRNPYFIFLTLLGYFGDNGDKENIPTELQILANDLLKSKTSFGVHDLMEKKQSMYSDGYYYEIERYVSALNTGKRMHWKGDIPLELLKSINTYQPFIYNFHPLAQQLKDYKFELRELYSTRLKIKDTKTIQYAMISSDKNIQGALAAKNAKDKPLLVINQRNNSIIGSMRVPDSLDFNAGEFLNQFCDKIPTCVGGGHEKAGGISFDKEHLDTFLDLLENCG